MSLTRQRLFLTEINHLIKNVMNHLIKQLASAICQYTYKNLWLLLHFMSCFGFFFASGKEQSGMGLEWRKLRERPGE